jgi:hypothetical protein
MIYQHYQKLKEYARGRQTDLFLAGLIFLVSVGSFGLGRLSAIWSEKEPVRITQNAERQTLNVKNGIDNAVAENASAVSAFSVQNSALGKYVASKNGTAYHYPWCSGAKRIKEENKIWFQTKTEAEAKGYKPAANCDGL